MDLYNSILELDNVQKYPFNLNSNLKENIIFTHNEIEIEYLKDYNIYINKKIKGSYEKKNIINVYIYALDNE